jgi:hypothetical protein
MTCGAAGGGVGVGVGVGVSEGVDVGVDETVGVGVGEDALTSNVTMSAVHATDDFSVAEYDAAPAALSTRHAACSPAAVLATVDCSSVVAVYPGV